MFLSYASQKQTGDEQLKQDHQEGNSNNVGHVGGLNMTLFASLVTLSGKLEVFFFRITAYSVYHFRLKARMLHWYSVIKIIHML